MKRVASELLWLVPVAWLALLALELRAQESLAAGSAQRSERVAPLDPSRGGDTAALTSVLLEHFRLPAGAYVAHCRRAHGGCEARARRMAGLFVQAGGRYRLDPWLLVALATRESGGDPNAVGQRGELGLLQLHPQSPAGRAAIRLCGQRPADCPAILVDAAAGVLRRSIDRCGDLEQGLVMYHTGECGPSDAYVRSVLARRDRMRGAS